MSEPFKPTPQLSEAQIIYRLIMNTNISQAGRLLLDYHIREWLRAQPMSNSRGGGSR